MSEDGAQDLCASDALADSGAAVAFDVVYLGQACRAFAVRYQGQVQAYLNRCGHVPMEMDYVEGQFFDSTGHWLMCATHGAMYAPASGHCVAGPCRRGLVKITVSEQAGRVRWHTSPQLQPPGW
ncbi:MAG: Rieske 2Fe-2S domain-containing protein [Burkholderiaceae bacterium]|jgi:nitrite reductase/ring-hydroxylating ferredoxin subunit|nr:Rieske 2Fe-2S domain-containing protein [Burkholderiaceae bacterium]